MTTHLSINSNAFDMILIEFYHFNTHSKYYFRLYNCIVCTKTWSIIDYHFNC